jgi:lipopolysaccharide transport system permease protein
MSGVIEAMRAGLLATGAVNWQLLGASALMSLIFFIVGVIYFNKTEKYFADIV